MCICKLLAAENSAGLGESVWCFYIIWDNIKFQSWIGFIQTGWPKFNKIELNNSVFSNRLLTEQRLIPIIIFGRWSTHPLIALTVKKNMLKDIPMRKIELNKKNPDLQNKNEFTVSGFKEIGVRRDDIHFLYYKNISRPFEVFHVIA